MTNQIGPSWFARTYIGIRGIPELAGETDSLRCDLKTTNSQLKEKG